MKLNTAIRISNTGYALILLGILLAVAAFMSWLEFGMWAAVCAWGAAAASGSVLAGSALAFWGFRKESQARVRDYPQWDSS